MLVRIVHFLLGALLAGGGGWLAWSNRASTANIFPPSPGVPWLMIAGMLGLSAGIVFLVSAVHPRPNRRKRLLEQAEIREAKLGAAESYYSERSAAADRDWRSSEIPAPVMPASAAEPAPDVMPPQPVPSQPVPSQPGPPQPVAAATVKPVATSAPPEPPAPTPFPATATLAPIPAAAEPPPAPTRPQPRIEPPAAPATPPPAAAPAPIPAAPATPVAVDPFAAIKTALANGQLEEAEKLLNAERDSAQGAALAELTGLAGDHAAAAGRASNAKWLWRLALKRFGELGAMDTPAARAVAESLRLAG